MGDDHFLAVTVYFAFHRPLVCEIKWQDNFIQNFVCQIHIIYSLYKASMKTKKAK